MKKKIISMAGLLLLIGAPALADTAKESETPAPSLEENRKPTELDSLRAQLADRLEFSALVEVEAFTGKDFSGEKTSDVRLATVELGLEAKIHEWISARLVALYEEGEEDDHLIIDEGTITLGNAKKNPFYLTAGRMYVPFGSYESFMVSDPLTLEIAETRDTALLAGFAGAGWHGSVYVFNGEVDESGENDTLSTFGASLAYKLNHPGWQLDLGADFINNLGDSNSLRDHIATTSGTVDDPTEAMALHAHLHYGGWSFLTEYIAALDSFQADAMNFSGSGARPKAWMLELAYAAEVAEREVTLALGYQRTDEAAPLGLPEHRYLGSIGVGLFSNTTLTLEYQHDRDYGLAEGGTDESAHQAVMQLAVAF